MAAEFSWSARSASVSSSVSSPFKRSSSLPVVSTTIWHSPKSRTPISWTSSSEPCRPALRLILRRCLKHLVDNRGIIVRIYQTNAEMYRPVFTFAALFTPPFRPQGGEKVNARKKNGSTWGQIELPRDQGHYRSAGDLDDVRTNHRKMQRIAALIYTHFRLPLPFPIQVLTNSKRHKGVFH